METHTLKNHSVTGNLTFVSKHIQCRGVHMHTVHGNVCAHKCAHRHGSAQTIYAVHVWTVTSTPRHMRSICAHRFISATINVQTNRKIQHPLMEEDASLEDKICGIDHAYAVSPVPGIKEENWFLLNSLWWRMTHTVSEPQDDVWKKKVKWQNSSIQNTPPANCGGRWTFITCRFNGV